MAERRMFAKSVVNSARFLRMPASSRLLYYDLGMSADDDGVVEAFSVMRLTGAVEDDLRVLVSKGFVRVMNDDLVTWIVDWKRNNLIKGDRYHQSVYSDLLVQIADGTQTEPTWNPSGTQTEPEVRLGKDSTGKDRIGEANKGAKRPKFNPPTIEEVEAYRREICSPVDPRDFVDFYAAKGWRVGKDSMKDWRAAFRRAANWDKYKNRAGAYDITDPETYQGGISL